jgi:spore germination protein (amino acid permease)
MVYDRGKKMKEKITAHQLFVIMVIVPYGTAILFYLAGDLKKDVVFGLIFYGFIAIIIQSIHISMFNKYPEDTIVSYMPKVYGKYIGFMMQIVYVVLFIYGGSRNLRDFTEIISVFMLPNVSMIEIAIFSMITILYCVYKGIENIASFSQIMFIIILITQVVSVILLSMTKDVFRFDRVLPFFENGIIPIFTKGWPLLFFPYGEFYVASMFYPFVIEKTKIRKAVYFATITEAVLLIANNIVFLLALGYHFASSVNHPLIETYRLIHIGEFLNRMEVILLVTMVLYGFIKISVFMYCAVLGIYQILNYKYWGIICIVVGIAILITSKLIARSFPEHVSMGLGPALLYAIFPANIAIPLLTFIVYYIKKLLYNVN